MVFRLSSLVAQSPDLAPPWESGGLRNLSLHDARLQAVISRVGSLALPHSPAPHLQPKPPWERPQSWVECLEQRKALRVCGWGGLGRPSIIIPEQCPPDQKEKGGFHCLPPSMPCSPCFLPFRDHQLRHSLPAQLLRLALPSGSPVDCTDSITFQFFPALHPDLVSVHPSNHPVIHPSTHLL